MRIKILNWLIVLNIAIIAVMFIARALYQQYAFYINEYLNLLLSFFFLLAFLHSITIKGIYLRGYIWEKDDKPFTYYLFIFGYLLCSVVLFIRFIKG
jgi:hypothetical protein